MSNNFPQFHVFTVVVHSNIELDRLATPHEYLMRCVPCTLNEELLTHADTMMCLGRIHINTLSEIQPLHCVEGGRGSGLTSPDDTPSLLDLDRGNTLGTSYSLSLIQSRCT